KTLLISLEEGSGYYWEIRNLYPNIKDGQYIGCATACLCCTQSPTNQPAKRISEARPTIQRFLYEGVIKIKIDLCEQKAMISVKHLAHKLNQYVTDVENQLNLAKNFLEQKELIDEEYKVILYCENEFVHALGFTTPFLQVSENITEI
ncbi:20223_t:CDS:2, partial [Cetraspora pellucida]